MKKAVALRYHHGLPAPFIVAKGTGLLADAIVRLANEYNIPLERREVLTEALFTVDVGAFIPEELYKTVAELLVFVQNVSLGKRDAKY